MSTAKRGLGKGLSALITQSNNNDNPNDHDSIVMEIDINKIEPNQDQPRKRFNEDAIFELAASIKEFGVIQPILVKKTGDYYSIIAGERRWRAARVAKLSTVPVIVKDYTDTEILQVALIENIQRQDLNPIEEALCYKRLIDEYFFTQEDISAKVGKSRNTISYSLGLLNLDNRVQNFVTEGKLTAGHARFLFQVKDPNAQFDLSEKIIEEELSVRDTEKTIKAFLEDHLKTPNETDSKSVKEKTNQYNILETDLKNILGTKVSIKNGKNKGKIEIEYYSPDELDRLFGIFKKLES